MTEKNFFFDPDPVAKDESGLTDKEHADTFFTTLQDIGIVEGKPVESMDEIATEADGYSKKLENRVLSVEYGIFKNDYSVHVTPLHHQKNLVDRNKFSDALRVLVETLNEHVPKDLRVDLYLPREDWSMKVISAAIRNGATAWNLDIQKLESEGVVKIFDNITKVIMS